MRNNRANWFLRFSTLVVVTACFSVLAGALLLTQNLNRVLTLWGEDVQMTIYLTQEITKPGQEFIENKIRSLAPIESITYVDQAKALSEFKIQMASYAPDVSKDDELLKVIPASLQVKLKTTSTQDQVAQMENIAHQIQSLEGVEEISYGQDWIAKYAALISTIENSFRFLGVILLAAALFVISNSIRASVASRKNDIIVLEMIGATSAMIRRPFLKEGAGLGLTASILALFFCFGIYTGIKNLLISKLSFLQLSQHLEFLGVGEIIFFVLCGTTIGALASYLCVRKINDGYAGSQGPA